MAWLGPSAARRRLRFSFQINDVKDPTGVSGPTVLRPVAAKSGVFSRRSELSQTAFFLFFRTAPRDIPETKKVQGARGASLKFRGPSRLKRRNLVV